MRPSDLHAWPTPPHQERRGRDARRLLLPIVALLLAEWAVPALTTAARQDEWRIEETLLVAGTGPGSLERQDVTALNQTHQLPAADIPTVISLVPNHVGLTIADQPVVYWYLSRPTQARTLFVLLDARSLQVVQSIILPPSERAGIQSVRFKDYGVTLQRDVPYRWFVNVLIDPTMPARDLVAGGTIERITPEFSPAKVPPSSSLDAVHFYAAQGLWYDAMAAISDLIATAPLNDLFRQQRASLLQQVGLQEVAEWDLRHRQMD